MQEALTLLHKQYPNTSYYLNYSNPLELVMAAILSPQVRDEVVNKVTPKLFQTYKTPKDYANADIEELTTIIKPITFSSIKAKHIQETGTILNKKFNGKVPQTVKELTSLPGVGEKTAHAILQNAFNIVEGVIVDTHVLRVSYRLGWSSHQKNANIVKRELENHIPKEEWKTLPHLLKAHGRAICKPLPLCKSCILNNICPKRGVA